MPVNDQLDIQFDPAQKTDIETNLDNVKTTLLAIIGAPQNLSDSERQSTPSVANQREPFVANAMNNLGPTYTNLHGPDVALARAQNCWGFRTDAKSVKLLIDEINDILIDATINAENVSYRFTGDLRANGQRYKEKNVPGADVVWDELKDMHVHTENPTPNPPEEPPV